MVDCERKRLSISASTTTTEKIVPVKQGSFLLINLALKNLVAGIIQVICVYQLFNYLISSLAVFSFHTSCFRVFFLLGVSHRVFFLLTFLTATCQSQLICNKCKSVTAQVVISTELTHASTQVNLCNPGKGGGRQKTQIYNPECKRKGVCNKQIHFQFPFLSKS